MYNIPDLPLPGDQWRGRRPRVRQGLRLRLQEGIRRPDLRDGGEECGVQGGPCSGQDRASLQRPRLSDGHAGLLRLRRVSVPLADGLRLQGEALLSPLFLSSLSS